MAKKPVKKPVAKAKKAPKPKAPAPKKSAAAKQPVSKAKPVKKGKPAPKKPAVSSSKKKSPSVKATNKKTTPKPAPKSAPARSKQPAKPVAKAAPAPSPKIVPAPKVVSKKGKVPLTPPPPPSKPVPLPKIKKPLLDAAPEIVIKQAYNPKKMPPFYKKQMQRLLELRSALYDTMNGMAQEVLRSRPEGSDASVGGMHMGDAGSDAYDRDFALSMLSKEQDALYEINEAIGRLEHGTYGICELSGKKIPDERLEAIPYTRYTREMQEQIERDNMGGRFRRPVVKSVFGLDDASEEDEEEEGDSPKEAPPQESSLDFMKE